MRLVATNSVSPDTILGKPILNEQGQTLINEGIKLSKRMIDRLINMNITYIYIVDEESKGIEPSTSISKQTQNSALSDIKTAFSSLIEENKLSNSLIIDHLGKNFKESVKSILNDLRKNKEGISLLSHTIGHDRYTFFHSLNVAIYSLAIAKALGYSEKQQIELGIGAMLYDIGKTIIPIEVLQKPEKLTTDEWNLIKKHPEYGFEILRRCHEISLTSAHCAYQHHERIDGTGYPRGLKGKEIHPYAKIIAVADVFGAVTSNRAYSKAILPHEGMELIFSGSQTLFDLEIIKVFRQTVAIYPVGLTVILSDGRKGIVFKQNIVNSERPTIRITEEKGKKVDSFYYLDLNKELNITIIDTETTLDGKRQHLAEASYYR